MKLHLLTYSLFLFFSSFTNYSPGLDIPTEDDQNRLEYLYQKLDTKNDNADSLSIIYADLGRLYEQSLKYDSAYKYYDLAIKIASESSDKGQLAYMYNIIGSYYYGSENYEEALEYYTHSHNLYKALNNPIGIASLANNLGEIERLIGDYKIALDYYYSAIKINLELKHHSNLSLNHNNIGLTYLHLHNYDSSFYHLKLAEGIAIQHNLNKNLNNILNSLGTYYMQIQKFDSSYYFLSMAFELSIHQKILFQIKENSRALHQLFEQIENIDSAYFYYKIYTSYNDSILNNKNMMRIGLAMVKNKLDNERRIEKVQQSRKEMYYFILFISIFSGLIILLLLWFNQKTKIRHSQLKMQHLSLEKKYLNNELTNFALHISENNLLLAEIKQSLRKLDVSHVNENQLNELKLKLNTELSNTQNKKILEQQVDEQNREFIQHLKNTYPTLTKSELKLCSLLKLNLSTKDIAAINRVSPQAVKIARYRLRKKLRVESEIRISDYLNGISTG